MTKFFTFLCKLVYLNLFLDITCFFCKNFHTISWSCKCSSCNSIAESERSHPGNILQRLLQLLLQSLPTLCVWAVRHKERSGSINSQIQSNTGLHVPSLLGTKNKVKKNAIPSTFRHQMNRMFIHLWVAIASKGIRR